MSREPRMKIESLVEFLNKKMAMGSINQPLLIKYLVDAGGTATIRQLASHLLAQDESRIQYYEKRIKEMTLRVLRNHGVISEGGDLVTLNLPKLTAEQKARIKMICKQKIQEYVTKRGFEIWDDMGLGDEPDPNLLRDCRFCPERIKHRIVDEYASVFAIADRHPVTEGHHLVIPKRHTSDWFSMTEQERRDAESLLRIIKNRLGRSDESISGFNVGMNCGESAGQTIFHAHIHLIPRRDGDTENPVGGVRGVIPDKMCYTI